MRRMAILFLAMVMTAAAAAAAPAAAAAETVTVSAAISLKESMEQIGREYRAKSGDVVTFNFDASGRLAAQIRQGAPVDAFVSAGTAEVDALVAAGQADRDGRRTVAGNALVLVVPAGDAAGAPTSWADLAHTTGKVAIGDPKSVPAGHYAEQVLAKLKLAESVKGRLIVGQNVRQVLTYVERGDVSAGLVYATDARAAGAKVRVVATADAGTHDPIEYPAVTVTGAAHVAAGKRFVDYLGTPAARGVFEAHGFTLPKPAAATRP